MHRVTTRRNTAALAAVLAALVAPPAGAQKGPKPKPKSASLAEPQVTLPPDVGARLASGDDAQVRSALDDVRLVGKGAAHAVPAVVDLLKRGVNASLAEAALDTLGDVESEASSEVVSWYALHRAASVRRAAVRALARTRGAVAANTLRRALSDADAGVRGHAAMGLGALKVREAVPDLFLALEHRVAEAAVSLGQLCKDADCEKLSDQLGVVPLDVMTGGLDQVLFRATSEVPEDLKVKLVGRVRELGTPEANRFLRDVQKRMVAAKWSTRLRQAVEQAVQATGGMGGGS